MTSNLSLLKINSEKSLGKASSLTYEILTDFPDLTFIWKIFFWLIMDWIP